ncbi:nuclear transport factor 2 family protein [Amycolatopsis jejuensis]|uniref:nuclear transport factor 2 family protein n=1 Tax=Amycolatopsis jejuensis TaxID=330084 RepID=UPI00068A6441|nr:nuclear transport factor 2 family protein [Amycolatopsis jejuensis]
MSEADEMVEPAARRAGRTPEEEIEALQRRYSDLCDEGYPGTLIADLFVADGIWENHPNGQAFEGRRAIAEHFSDGSQRFPWAVHINVPRWVEVDDSGDFATGEWFLIMPCAQMTAEGLAGGLYVGKYHNDFVRIDGCWMFERLRITFELMAPNSADWAQHRFSLLDAPGPRLQVGKSGADPDRR